MAAATSPASAPTPRSPAKCALVPSNSPWRRKATAVGMSLATRKSRMAALPSHALRPDVRHGHAVLLHLLADRDDDRTGPAAHRHVEGVGHDLGDAPRVVDLRDPLRERAEHAAVVHLLEALAVRLLDRDLTDQQHHRRRVLHRHVHADRGMAGAGPARHDGDTRLAGQLAMRLGHVDRARLEAAGDEFDAVALRVEPVQQVKVALAWHGKGMGGTIGHQGIREQLPPRPFHDPRAVRHGSLRVAGGRKLDHGARGVTPPGRAAPCRGSRISQPRRQLRAPSAPCPSARARCGRSAS